MKHRKKIEIIFLLYLVNKLFLFSGTLDKALDWDGRQKVYNENLLYPERLNLIELPYEHYPLILMTSPAHLTYQALLKVLNIQQ